jgi:ATP-dependent Clp protease ATP-binding subunit ClpC
MFERFSEAAIRSIMLAQEESRRLGHNFVGTEQIMLGLIGERNGIAAKTLTARGVNLEVARDEVEKIIRRGSGHVSAEIPFTPRTKRVFELSWEEARLLNHNYVGTEHLLLGLIRENEGVAIRVLENFGIDISAVRGDVLRQLGEQPSEEAAASSMAKLGPSGVTTTCPNCAEIVKSAAHVCHWCDYGISDEQFVGCRFCKERIRKDAVRCKHCHAALDDPLE